MRVAHKLSLSMLRQSPARLWLVRIGVAILASVLLLAVWHPHWLAAQAAPTDTVMPAAILRISAQPPTTKLAPLKKRPPAKPVTVKDTASATHRVKAGETLWSIATRYYGDGHQWRIVARRNGIAMTGETALRAGAELVIPSPRYVATATSALPAPLDTATPKAALTPALPALPRADAPKPMSETPKTGKSLAAQTTGKANSAAPTIMGSGMPSQRDANAPNVAISANPTAAQDTSDLTTMVRLRPQIKAERLLTRGAARIGLVDNDELRASRKSNEQATIFLLNHGGESSAGSTTALSYHAAVAPRHGEYASAPFAVEEPRWQKAGRVQRRVDDEGPSHFDEARMQLADEVIIAPPAGVTLAVGDQLVAVKRAGATANGIPVAFPTGVLEVIAVGDGRLVRAFVRSESGVIEQGQALFPIEGSAAPVGQQLAAAPSGDMTTTVSWIEPTSVMPTLQSFVLLTAGEAQGVKAGDLFSLVRRADSGKPERLAVVRVVRVGRQGSAAIIIKHDALGVDLGLSALRVSRAP